MTADPAPAASTTNVAGVVLTFEPDASTEANVRALAAQVPTVFVVDNGSSDAAASLFEACRQIDGVTVLPLGRNTGVAAGFNAGMRAAFDAGAGYVCIFDQDSTVTDGMIGRLLEVSEASGDRCGVVAPALRSATTGRVYRRESGEGSAVVPVLISSGSLFSRRLVERIGYHDEPLFIDYVDHDICLRAHAAGLRNVKVFDALLDHRFGDSRPRRLLGRDVYLADYSLRRHFFQARNRLIVVRRYGFGRWFFEDAWFTAKAWVKVLLLEQRRGRKVAAALRGTAAGLRYPARERRW